MSMKEQMALEKKKADAAPTMGSVQELGSGCYLTHEPNNQGTFFQIWSESAIEVR
jgi:hypothetical protein